MIANSKHHLKMGESMAQLRAQPRLMTSVALSVRLGSFLKKSRRLCSTAGTLEEPPVTSTDTTSPSPTFASSSACSAIATHSESDAPRRLDSHRQRCH